MQKEWAANNLRFADLLKEILLRLKFDTQVARLLRLKGFHLSVWFERLGRHVLAQQIRDFTFVAMFCFVDMKSDLETSNPPSCQKRIVRFPCSRGGSAVENVRDRDSPSRCLRNFWPIKGNSTCTDISHMLGSVCIPLISVNYAFAKIYRI